MHASDECIRSVKLPLKFAIEFGFCIDELMIDHFTADESHWLSCYIVRGGAQYIGRRFDDLQLVEITFFKLILLINLFASFFNQKINNMDIRWRCVSSNIVWRECRKRIVYV